MKLLPRLILACATLATCTVAGAQTFNAAADQDRRARNREEALAKYHAAAQDRPATRSTRVDDRREPGGGPTLGDRTRNATKSVRNFTHRQAEKARNFSDRQDRRWGNRNSASRQGTNRNKSGGTPE